MQQFSPDLKAFVRSVAELRKDEDSFSEQDFYRLKKTVTEVKAQLIKDDDWIEKASPHSSSVCLCCVIEFFLFCEWFKNRFF